MTSTRIIHARLDGEGAKVLVAAIIPDAIPILTLEDLPLSAANLGSKALGDAWLDSFSTAALRVSSAVVPSESNYLLNPLHVQFGAIVVEPPAAFSFDERLFAVE